MYSSGFLMRLVIYGLQDECEFVFNLGFTKQVISQVVGFNLVVLLVLDHNLVSVSIYSYSFQFPDFQVKASAFTLALYRLHVCFGCFRRLLFRF